jgi:hypothetical protein
MASFNFKPQFVPCIESGVKGGTIRSYRRHPQKLGKPMHLFSGLRQVSPAHRIEVPGLGPSPKCVAIQSIIITERLDVWLSGRPYVSEWAIRAPKKWEFVKLQPDEKERLAIFDGFDSFDQMMSFWDGRLPFLGNWCCWLTPPGRVIASLGASA